MSGRAVGGAAGAGCGVFTVLGILVSVALTVWLGSHVIGGGGGGGTKTGNEVVDENNAIASDAIEGIMEAGGSGTEPPRGSVDVTLVPDSGFAPDTWIKVAGSGFQDGGRLQLVTCKAGAKPVSQGDRSLCDWSTARSLAAEPDGMLLTDYLVKGTVTIDDTVLDCAATRGACVLIVAPPGYPDRGESVPLEYASS